MAFFWKLLSLIAHILPRALGTRLLLLRHRKQQALLVASRQDVVGNRRAALLEIVARNQRTEFGQRHGFGQIHDEASYQSQVPLREYRSFEADLLRHAAGEQQILVNGAPIGLAEDDRCGWDPRRPFLLMRENMELRLLAEAALQRAAIALRPAVTRGEWLALLPYHGLESGESIAQEEERVPRAPISALVVGDSNPLPSSIFCIKDEALRYYVALRLSAGRRVSAWRAGPPGALTILAQHLEQQGEQLIEDIAAGTIHCRDQLDPQVRDRLPHPAPDRRTAERLKQALQSKGRLEPRDVWPELALLACDSTGAGAGAKERLPDRFGDIPVLETGPVLASGLLCWPGPSAERGELALPGQVWEFCSGERALGQDTLPPHALRVGERYRPVLTAKNGLYRHLLDLLVEVTELDVVDGTSIPRLAVVGRPSPRVALEIGALRAEELGAAVTEAARSINTPIVELTAWIGAVSEPASELPQKRSWLSRLLRRDRKNSEPDAALTLLIEPNSPDLEEKESKRLLQAIDRELRQRSSSYAADRDNRRLGSPRALLLQRGCFARLAHQRVANGYADAHAPLPLLMDRPWTPPDEDVLRSIPD